MRLKPLSSKFVALTAALMLAACNTAPSPTGNTAGSTSASGWEAEWQNTLVAAKKEKLVIMTHPGTNYEAIIKEFQKKFPDIKVEHNGIRPSDFSSRVIGEQKNGVFAWDVMYASTSNMTHVLQPTGAFQDIRPFVLLPDAKDDSKWAKGAEFYSSDKPEILVDSVEFFGDVYVNRDMIPKAKLSTLDDLLKPEFKGKIVADDCSLPAHGLGALMAIAGVKGLDFVKKLMTEQKVVLQKNVRTTTEWAATGRFPIAIGTDPNELSQLQDLGQGKNVERIDMRAQGGNIHTRGVAIFKNAPHPNAAKVFTNWILTKEGQLAMLKGSKETTPPGWNSRRTDVPLNAPEIEVDLRKIDLNKYVSWTMKSGQQMVTDIQSLCRDLSKAS